MRPTHGQLPTLSASELSHNFCDEWRGFDRNGTPGRPHTTPLSEAIVQMPVSKVVPRRSASVNFMITTVKSRSAVSLRYVFTLIG